MADYGTLFMLVLVALTFVIVGICFIIYMMIMSEREKRRRAEDVSPPRDASAAKCHHQSGHLSGYPLDQPIPEECFGCAKALQCMNQKTLPIGVQVAQLTEEQED